MKAQNKLNKYQQRKFFVVELTAFAVLFALLGLVVSHFFEVSVYTNIDQGIIHQEQALLQPVQSRDDQQNHSGGGPTRFQADNVIYDKNGKILNANALGNRYSVLKKIKFNPKQMENKLATKDVNGNYFRVLLIRANTVDQKNNRYVLIAENIDTQMNIIAAFNKLLMVILIVFWAVAILISFWLSRYFMKPILKAWNKQQEFVANAAHELRTPLTIIQNKLEYLFTKPKRSIIDETEPINQALNETKRLSRLTTELLTIARSDSNTLQVKPTEIKLADFLPETVEPYEELAASQDKSLTYSNSVAGFVTIDPDLLKQVVVILLDNALKYTNAGDKIEVATEPSGRNNWKLTVANTGKSISDADKKQIFERFYRVDKSRNKTTGGNGLGLSIAQWIIAQHHGKISVADMQPSGVVFTCIVPIKG